jgi:diguanylate cyclase (GGDEF)-like protein/PAS domain S-box-containing protein
MTAVEYFEHARALGEISLETPGSRLLVEIGKVISTLLESPLVRIGPEVSDDCSFNIPIRHAEESFGYIGVGGRAGGYADAERAQLETLAPLIGWLLHQHEALDQRLKEAQGSAERLAAQAQILDQIYESVITMDLAGYITGWNKGAEKLFGYSVAEAVGKHILFLYADPDAEEDSDGFHDAFLEYGGREMEVRRRRKSGEVFWASLQLSILRDDAGHPSGLIGYLSDITARVEAEKSIRLQARIFENSEESIVITGADRRILSVNPAFCRISGYQDNEIIGKPHGILRSDKHPDSFYEDIWRAVEREGKWQGEAWSRRKNGENFPVWGSISLVRNREDQVSHYFSIFSDITERKRAEERIHYLAYYDDLTGLPNRALLYKLTDQALIEARRSRLHGALLFVDLNRFKPINDTLGHGVGDRLLTQVAERLRETVRAEDVVARLGGDEFVIGLFDITRREHAAVVAQKLLTALDPPFWVDEHELKAGAAIGISIYPRDGFDTESLLRMADIAMYRAKQGGQDGYAFYSQEMNHSALDRLKIESGLRRGIERNELLLHYQPKVDIASGRIVGAEALVRWHHPERGLVPPNDFVPIAEESGLIVRLTAWVLEEALRQARAWQDAGLVPLKVAVNLSARDFSPGLAERVRLLLDKHGVPPSWLELEITEGMLTHSNHEVIAMMDAITALGVSLSLDDFGTGYSSLTYLKRFPIDTLKIDRSFVTGIPDDGNDCAIAGAIASMAQRLGHRVIAEGVETEEQLAFLRSLGCQEMQGFLFSAPVPAEEFETMVRAGRQLNAPPPQAPPAREA